MKRALFLALVALAVPALPAEAAQTPGPRLTKIEAFAAAATINRGRTFELARPLVPTAEYGKVVLLPTAGPTSRIGRRAVVVPALLVAFRPATAPLQVGLLIRKRLSGRIVVSVVVV